MANRCVQRQTDIGSWAIEIDPPGDSGAQLTEIPAADGTTVVQASATLMLQVSFTAGTSPTAAVPDTATVLVTIPSVIPGRPDLSFQANLQPGTEAATVPVPVAIRGRAATVTLIPVSPADQSFPPFTFTTTIPATGSSLPTQPLPTSLSTVRGQLRDALGTPKGKYTARAFRGGVFVSTAGSTSPNTNNDAGNFAVALPSGIGKGNDVSDRITVQLAPDASGADPWVTFSAFALTQVNTDLGTIMLPGYAGANPFQVTVHGDDQGGVGTPEIGAAVRAFTTLPSGDDRFTTQFFRDGTTDAQGSASLSLIPGDSRVPRPYTVSVVPAAGSPWASQCIQNVGASWNGVSAPVTLLQDVTLTHRPTVSGTVVSAGGTPVANVVVTATGGSMAADSCLPGPSVTSATTSATGTFSLPLDPGVYQLEYDPPAGSAVPRATELNVAVAEMMSRLVQLPAPALVEGDVHDAMDMPLPNATIRIFEPRCEMVTPCTTRPLLRAQTLSDENGHFRVVVAATPTN
ncbi:MAG TPA: carboxypeptidase regulatory-like domain-containing protein [Polyangia bacterium]